MSTATILLIVALAALILAAETFRRVWTQQKLLDELFVETGHAQFGELLALHQKRLQTQHENVRALHSRVLALEDDNTKLAGRVGLVKYNPFDGGGGNMSFSLAIVNSNGSGVIVTSLHSNQGMRLYSKAINDFDAEQQLTEEERQALEQARSNI